VSGAFAVTVPLAMCKRPVPLTSVPALNVTAASSTRKVLVLVSVTGPVW
jgi:hypothetical protein